MWTQSDKTLRLVTYSILSDIAWLRVCNANSIRPRIFQSRKRSLSEPYRIRKILIGVGRMGICRNSGGWWEKNKKLKICLKIRKGDGCVENIVDIQLVSLRKKGRYTQNLIVLECILYLEVNHCVIRLPSIHFWRVSIDNKIFYRFKIYMN